MIDDIEVQEPASPVGLVEAIPKMINKNDVAKMVEIQTRSIKRLEDINRSVLASTDIAQEKLSLVSKLFKKSSKQISESKRDLDVIYKKLASMKHELRIEKPDLFPIARSHDDD